MATAGVVSFAHFLFLFHHRDQISSKVAIKSLHAHGDLLVTIVNNLDRDKARQNVGPDPIPSCLTLSFCL